MVSNKKSTSKPDQAADLSPELSGLTLYEQVRLAKQEWESTADSLPQIVCLLDEHGYIQRINRSVERWGLGKVTDSPGVHFHELFHPDCTDSTCYLQSLWQRAREQITGDQSLYHEGYDSLLARHLSFQVQPFITATHRDKLKGDRFAILLVEDVTRRVHMEQSLRQAIEESDRRAAEALAILQGSQAILKYRDMNSAVRSISGICSDLLGVGAVYLFFRDAETAQPEILVYYNQTVTSLSQADLPPAVRTLSAQVELDDCTVYQNGLNPASLDVSSPIAQPVNLLFTPLYIDMDKVGLLGVANKPGEFNEEDARLVRAFAELAAIALYNSKTLHSLKSSELRYQELFESVPIGIYRTTPDGQFLEANHALVKLLGCHNLEALLAFNVERFYVNPEERVQHLSPAVDCSSVQTFKAQLRRCDGSLFWAFSSVCAVCTPDGEVCSYIGSMEDITQQMEVEHQQAQGRDDLEKRNRQLQALNRAALVFGSTLDLDQLLLAVIDETLVLLEATATSVWLLDEENQELICRQATGPSNELLYGWKLPVGKGLVGWVAQHNQSMIVWDAQMDERHYTGVDEQTGFDMRSILSVPLCVRERLIGVLQAVDTRPDRFDETQLAFLESLATFAATAIENARLNEQAQQEINTRRWVEHSLQWELDVNIALAELSHVLLSSEFSIQQIANLTLDYARQLTGSEQGFVSVIDPRTRENVSYTLTKMITDGRCEITDENQKTVFPCGPDGHYNGLWGYALNMRQAFFTNSPASHPASHGVPQGHIPLRNFLAAPALVDELPVGEIALANNSEGYAEYHLGAIREMANIFAQAVQRLQAEQALSESEDKYRRLVEISPNLVAVHQNGNFVFINSAGAQMLGAENPAQVIDKNLSEFLHPEWIEVSRARAQSVQAGNIQELGYEQTIRRLDGTEVSIEVVGSPFIYHGEAAVQIIARDITERKQAERALQESERRFHSLYESMTEGVSLQELICDEVGKPRDYRVLDVNPAYETIMGITRQQAVGALASQLYGSGEPPFLQMYANVVETGKPASLDVYYMEIDRHFHMEAFSPAQGQFATVFTDISHRKAAEREIEQRNKELSTLFRISQSALVEQQRDDLYQSFAAEISAITGFPMVIIEEYDLVRQMMIFRGSVGLEIPAGELFEAPVDLLPSGQVVRSGEILVETQPERLIDHLDERLRSFDVKTLLCFPMIAGQQVIGAITLGHQLKILVEERLLRLMTSLTNYIAVIIQRWETAQSLEYHARQLQALNTIANIPQPAFSLQDTLQLVLEKTLEITGMDGGWLHFLEPDGENLTLFVHKGISLATVQEIQRISIRYYLTKHIASSTQTILIPDATADFSLDARITQREERKTVTGTPIRVKDKLIAALTLFSRSSRSLTPNDINLLTAIGNQMGLIIENTRLAEEAAEVGILRQVDQLRSELLANVSHEIRTPLGLIKIFATTLLRPDVTVDAQTQQEFLHNIDEETSKLEEIVNNLLLSSRLEAGSQRLVLQPADLNELVRTVSQDMSTYGLWHHIELDLPEQTLEANVDTDALEQVLRNLLNNAVKYSPEGSTIVVGMRPEADDVVVWVRDFGIGISPEEIVHIFERFYRVDNAITRQVRGAGLGLSISQKLVELHGGRMWVESQPGSGATFYFSLPW